MWLLELPDPDTRAGETVDAVQPTHTCEPLRDWRAYSNGPRA